MGNKKEEIKYKIGDIMSNMSHCRFWNTKMDLDDCFDEMRNPISESEFQSFKDMTISIIYEIKYLEEISEMSYEEFCKQNGKDE